MIKIVTVEQMHEIEAATDAAGVSYADMMQHAGKGVADVVMGLLGELTPDKRVAVLVGPGNNGGDGLVAARVLKEEAGLEVGCYLYKKRGDDDPVYVAARDAGVFLADAKDDQRWRTLRTLVENADVVIDALLGTGAKLPIRDELKKLIQMASRAIERSVPPPDAVTHPAGSLYPAKRRKPVVAVDCPSGLETDTGELDLVTIPADVTVTFAAAKYGQLTFPGASAVGDLFVVDIGTPSDLGQHAAITTELATASGVKSLLPERPRNSHKGTYGRAVIIAGSVNYTGAAALAGAAAYRVGAGLVTMAVPQIIYPILASQVPEATWLLLPHDMGALNPAAVGVFKEEVGDVDALLLGPGLGQDDQTADFIRGLLRGERKAKKGSIGFVSQQDGEEETAAVGQGLPGALVIDADGLNLLAGIEDWWEYLPPRTILTPHPGEMARLTGMDVEDIQANRIDIAREKSAAWDCVVILKGAFTIIADPGGSVAVLPFATDALATAGTGDVLAGSVVGLLAQGVPSFEAAVSAAFLHGLAGEIASEHMPSASVVAGSVLQALPEALLRVKMS